MTDLLKGQAQGDFVSLDGWQINNSTLGEALDGVQGLAQANESSLVVTPNAQHLRLLRTDPDFRDAYSRASMRFADGMPLVWASNVQGTPLKERVSGSDLERGLCARLERVGGHVLYIGGDNDEINTLAVSNRQAQFPGLQVSGRSPSMGFTRNADETAELVGYINDAVDAEQPTAIFVCAGAPKSEIWAAANLDSIRHGVVLPVGAAIDFAAGIKSRANEKMQKGGLEWLHRMSSEPRRLGPRYAKDALFLGGLMARSLATRTKQV